MCGAIAVECESCGGYWRYEECCPEGEE